MWGVPLSPKVVSNIVIYRCIDYVNSMIQLYIRLAYAIILFAFIGMQSSVYAQDPYENVSFHELDNGMTVVLAPGSKAGNISVKIRVDVGSISEDQSNLGVSHLLEHLIFRDSRFDDEQTYLQLIKENGGKVNAFVSRDATVYYALMPSEKGEWLVEQFGNMLFDHTIDEEAIMRAKSSVELEIGEPSWLAGVLGTDVLAPVFHRYFPEAGFFESEFGLSDPSYSMNEIRLSSKKLTHEQLDGHYQSFYRPSNMVIFVSGNFNQNQMLSQIKGKFGTQPRREGRSVPSENPLSSNKPYQRIQWNPYGSPYIYIGTKILKPVAQEKISLYVYLDYIAHRLMKELRNKRGETYTARVYADERSGAGYGLVAFETQNPELQKNLQYVESLIDREARNGALTDVQIVEAIKLTREQRFELADVDADSLMSYAENYYDFRQEHSGKGSPYDVITSITPDEFRASLPGMFKKENAYTSVIVPYVYSKIEFVFISMISIVISIVVFQKALKRKIDETKIVWSQNITYSPAMFFEIMMCLIFTFFINHVLLSPIDRYVSVAHWYHSASLWPEYIYSSLSMFMFIGVFMALLALFPRKLMIEGDKLVLKSMALYARKFDKSSITLVRSLSMLDLITSPGIWFNRKFRFFYYSGLIWRKGLLLELSDRRTYFLDMKNADLAVSKMNEHLLLQNPPVA